MSNNRHGRRLKREALVFRILWMLFFLLAWHIAVPLLALLVLAQLLYRLLRGEVHAGLAGFGSSLSGYLQQIGRFAVFATEEKPWPVADWPNIHS